jgi:hypothetical protein
MRIINKFAFDRMYKDFQNRIIEVEDINDCYFKIILDTAEIISYLLYVELIEIDAKKNDNIKENWIKITKEEIINPWLHEEINIINDIFVATLRAEDEQFYAICYRDIVVGLTLNKPTSVEIKISSYKPTSKVYIFEVLADGKDTDMTLHDFKSREEVMNWIEAPWDITLRDLS